jgi:hypothetical protein
LIWQKKAKEDMKDVVSTANTDGLIVKKDSK